ncbi:MAG TPA: hypothetical protein VFU14_17005, partial [Acidimicrobiales bacterium]|nr:hypothetical protein [Acidimicrobiales bacterium]
MTRTRRPLLALLLPLLLVAAACGQKADVAGVSAGGAAGDAFGTEVAGGAGAFDDVGGTAGGSGGAGSAGTA